MADDIITLGGSERDPRHGADEAIESLFHAYYPRLARAAFALVGDRDLAEQLALQAYLRLWQRRRWRRISDQQATAPYLRSTVARLSRPTVRRQMIERRALERVARKARGAERSGGPAAGPSSDASEWRVDSGSAWQDFEGLRSRAGRKRSRGLVAVVVAVSALACTATALAGGQASRKQPGPGSVRSAGLRPPEPPPALPPAFPGAIVARIPLRGVISVVGNAARVWAVRVSARTGTGDRYQLVGIDPLTNKVTLRLNLGLHSPVVAVGGGMVWMTTPFGRAGGQVVRIDPDTGRVTARLHLPAGGCTFIGDGGGDLIASCAGNGPSSVAILGIDPATGRVTWQQDIEPGPGYGGIVVAARSGWYVVDYTRIVGLVASGDSVRAVAVDYPAYQASDGSTQPLAYADGAVWVLGSDQGVARVDPDTGRVTRLYTARGYDPAGYGGLNVLTAGDGSLWFLDDAYRLSGVLRVSMATGLPVGRVPIAADSCGQQSCSQIYATPGAIWVPTAGQLIRIDPALMPAGASVFARPAACPRPAEERGKVEPVACPPW